MPQPSRAPPGIGLATCSPRPPTVRQARRCPNARPVARTRRARVSSSSAHACSTVATSSSGGPSRLTSSSATRSARSSTESERASLSSDCAGSLMEQAFPSPAAGRRWIRSFHAAAAPSTDATRHCDMGGFATEPQRACCLVLGGTREPRSAQARGGYRLRELPSSAARVDVCATVKGGDRARPRAP